MKKILVSMFVAIAAMVTFSACSSNDDEEAVSNDVVVGAWVTTSVEVDGKWYDVTTYPYSRFSASATFYSDGTYYGRGSLGTGRGTWKLSGATITTYVDGEAYIIYKVLSLKDNTMEGTMSQGGTSMNFKAKKQ